MLNPKPLWEISAAFLSNALKRAVVGLRQTRAQLADDLLKQVELSKAKVHLLKTQPQRWNASLLTAEGSPVIYGHGIHLHQ